MEIMDIILATSRDLSHRIVNHPIYSVLGCIVLSHFLLRLYCRLTLGMCSSDQDMHGKTVLITGASAGIGKATAKDLAGRNARVILACRNLGKAERVAAEIVSSTGNSNVVVKHLDLSSFDSVRRCAEDVLKTEEKLHVLINNAGTYAVRVDITEDGCEHVMQSNHLGHFLLTLLLLDLLKNSAPSRIINVSSIMYVIGNLDLEDMQGYKQGCWARAFSNLYNRSKLANVLFTTELASRLIGSGVTVNALHPGWIKTNIFPYGRHVLTRLLELYVRLLGKSLDEGAQTSVYLAVHPEVEKTSGKFFCDCKEMKLLGKARDGKMAEQLFEASEKIVGTTLPKCTERLKHETEI